MMKTGIGWYPFSLFGLENIKLYKHFEQEKQIQMKLTQITFDIPLTAYQIPQFRGAMVAMLGRENDRFHNHDGEKNYHYRYPRVQYRQKAGRASLVMIGEREQNLEDVGKITAQTGRSIQIGDQEYKLYLHGMSTKDFDPKITETPLSYRLHHWIALNRENYAYWQEHTGLTKRMQLLERLLPNHIMQFAKGVSWYPEAQLEVEIISLDKMKFLRLHGVKHLTFDLTFKVNAELPYQIGLGKGVTYGFGILKSQRKR